MGRKGGGGWRRFGEGVDGERESGECIQVQHKFNVFDACARELAILHVNKVITLKFQ
jgi:hypothetical protein